MKILSLFLMMMLGTSIVMAHPGHGLERDSFSLVHYLIEPIHLITGITLIGVIALIFWLKKETRKNHA